MKIQINEVWNAEGRSEQLAVIEAVGNPYKAVRDWVATNRPDLVVSCGLFTHGYQAQEIK